MSVWSSFIAGMSPQAWYRHSESSGTTMVDSSGNGRDGTYRATDLTYASTGAVTGDSDTAIDAGTIAAGTGAYVGAVTDASWMNATSAVTFVQIMKSTSAANFSLTRWDTTTANQFAAMDFSANKARFYVRVVSTAVIATGSTTVNDGNYHLLIGVFDGATVKVYVDGALDGTATPTGTGPFTISVPTTGRGLWVGGRYATTANGGTARSHDESAFFNYAFTAVDVATAWAAMQGVAAVTASGSLSLSASGAGVGVTSGSGALAFSGSGSTTSAGSGSGSLTFSASGTGSLPGTAATGTGSLTFSASGVAKAAPTASGSLTLSGSGVVRARATGSGSLALSGTSATRAVSSGSGSVTLSAAGRVAPAGVASLTISGSGTIAEVLVIEDQDFQITVLDEEIWRAPTSITVVVDGGRPNIDITFYMDNNTAGQDIAYVDTLDSSGGLDPTSLEVVADLGGQQGTRTLTATQPGLVSGTLSTSTTYFVTKTPQVFAAIQGPDADPVEIDEAVDSLGIRHWVLQDLLPEVDGGIGSYVLPINPREMTSPHLEFALKTHHTTAHSGIYHVYQAGNIPKEWSFSGVAPTQEMVEKLLAYRDLNRRFYVIDHHNRAWKTVFSNVEVVPRLRTNYNGLLTDWFTDFTVTAVVVDQNWSTPV